MTTLKDMVAESRRMAYGSMSEQINLVATEYTAGADELYLELDVSGITPGMVLSSGLNVWYVKGIEAAEKLVYVIPGYDNAPGGVAAVNDFVYIKPKVTEWFMFDEMGKEITRLSSPDVGLYKIASWEVEADPTWQTYEIPSTAFDMAGLLRVRYRVPGSEDVWIDIPEKSYRVQFTDSQSSSYVRLLRNIPSGTDVKFIYKGPFTAPTSLSDDPVADCGLTPTMVDIPPLGVLGALLRTTESRRGQVQTQGDSRRAGEVPPGTNSSMAARIDREYSNRVREEYARLVQRVSIVRSL